jgi:flagellar biosynthesis protein FlhF
MIVKSFEGLTMKDAMRAVKREFGSEAVILSTQEKILEGTGAKIVEVRAAAAEEKKLNGAISIPSSIGSAAFKEIGDRINIVDAKVTRIAETVPTKANLQNIEGGLQELRHLLLDALKHKEGSLIEGLPNHLVAIERTLRLTHISEKYVLEVLRFLQGIPEPGEKELSSFESKDDYFKTHALRWMLKRIKVYPRWENLKESVAVQIFVGPSGSGKTTTIGKIAAHYKRKEKLNVLLVSFDQMRLAATEQLRVYAKIIDCPFVTISKVSELEKAILDHPESKLVLVDTSGRYPRHDDQIQDLIELRTSSIPVDFHLVLSLTEKEEHLDRAIRGFSTLGISSLLFSKLDESWTFGEIFNLSHKWSLPLSFFSHGQKVPDDLERASRERVVERIFGL